MATICCHLAFPARPAASPALAALPPAREEAPARQSGGAEASEWRGVQRSRPAAFGGSEPQVVKRQRVAAGGAAKAAAGRKGAAAAAPAIIPASAPALAINGSAAEEPLAAAVLAAGPCSAAVAPPHRQQAAAQPPGSLEQRVQELQAVLHRQQLEAAAREEQVAALQREKSSLLDQCASWKATAEKLLATRQEASDALLERAKAEVGGGCGRGRVGAHGLWGSCAGVVA